MKVNRAVSYGIQALVHMARDPDRQYTSHEVARAEGIPERFLLKVLKPLVSAGMLHSLRGPNGGFRLARPASKITILEILEAVEGPIHGQVEQMGVDVQGSGLRKLQDVIEQAAEETRKRLGRVSIADLAGKGK